MKKNEKNFHWTDEEYQNFSRQVQLLPHRYDQSALFNDTALIDLLDNYPRIWLQCYTMGTNPENHNEWAAVHIANSSGAEIVEVLQKSRIWINAIHINKYKKHYADLIRDMYHKIEQNCPHMSGIRPSFSALLLSSPGIQVYYHLDPDPNMLWHLKGTKKVWVYPVHDTRFTKQHVVEEIIGQERHENMPYESWFDDYSQCFELHPGELVSWPQHSPHRVENMDFNVSLTTSYASRKSKRLNGVYAANHYFLKKMGVRNRSTQTEGLIPATKSFCFSAFNKLKWLKHGNRTETYISDLKVDAKSESGLSRMAEKSRTAFSFIEEN